MKFIKTLLASSISLLLLGAAGCSDNTTQDTQQEDATSFTGLVIDGRIARGFVWIDTDDDGIIDTHEPYAYTDQNGYFSYSPLTNTDYCEDVNHQYCLKTGMVEGDFIIRIAGGVDLSTGEPFYGVMKLQGNTNDAKEVEQQVLEITTSSDSKPGFLPVISPLTTLVGSLTDAEKAELLTKIGITDVDEFNVEDLLKLDFTDFTEEVDNESTASAKSHTRLKGAASQQTLTNINTFASAVQYQKNVDTITALFEGYLENQGIDLSTDEDGNTGIGSLSGLVSEALNEYIASYEESDVAQFSNSKADNITWFSITPIVIRDIFATTIFNLRNSIGSGTELIPRTSVNFSTAISNINGVMDNTLRNVTTVEDFNAGLISTQTIATTINEVSNQLSTDTGDSENTALNIVNNVTTQVQTPEFIDAIKTVGSNNQTIDVKQLSDDLANGNSVTDSVTNSTLAEAPQAGEDGIWAQRVLSMSGKSEDGERGRVMFFFGGDDTSSTEGDVSVCYAYNANNNDDDITSVLLKGTWQELNSRGIVQVNQDLVSFTIKASKQAIIPVAEQDSYLGLGSGTGPDPDIKYGHLRFVNDGKSEIWFSDVAVEDATNTRDFGLLESANIPTTAAQCESFEVNGIPNALHKNLGF
ncbi:hypothetical protein KO505_10170 [Psychrosphaera sp. F3M07]|uniref:hypothetical protein n=1 Tax=Psychrosphaera sp. F3M07 TaxID=2841560 RepID=UPI001C082C15|nr:hypothetical protein [Psychrosphaera sp. F3M07]MBU2918331.1 hypothetical protein [Psychrosphaera sp. F3M07]